MFWNACSKRLPDILRTFARLALAISFAAGVLALATAAQASPSSLRDLPQEMQGAVSGALGLEDRSYHVEQAGENCRGLNAAQQFEANWSEDGLAIQAGKLAWGLRLEAWGYGDELVSAGHAVPQANEHRVEYHRSGLTEWYVNGPLGIEQGFTVLSPPKGTSSGGALTVRLAWSGEARVQVEEQSAAVVSNFAGEPVLRFSGLNARDASGRGLRTWLEQRGAAILLRVDDREATYPVVIDPLIQDQKLTASDGAAFDQSGYSVSLSADGNTALIGAENATVGVGSQEGAAYVFVRSGGIWSEQEKLTASDGAVAAFFGWSVSLSADGNTALIGAEGATVGTNSYQGAAYVFVRSGVIWSQQQKLTASDGAANAYFGYSVSLSGDGNTALIGAEDATVGANTGQGAAYVFVRSGGTWSQAQKFTDGGTDDEFGYSVSLSGDGNTALIGAAWAKVGANTHQGAAYVFARSGVTWSQKQTLTASDGAAMNIFGASVSLSGDGSTALIGALATVGANAGQGAAYVFVNSGGTWSEQQKLTASDGAASDQFGYSVSLSGDGNTALIGAADANAYQGVAYVFARSGRIWSQLQKLTAWDDAADAYFGNSVALSSDGNTSLIGVPWAKVGANTHQGAAYVYVQSGSLTVTISPAAAVSAGAMWSVDGEAWQASGATVSNLSIGGSHTVAFSGMQGWTAPPSQTVTISYGVPASAIGTYTPFFAAIFTASTTGGKAPLKVHFTNSSAGSFTKWLWHFGDGQTSKIWNPNHTYSKPRTYTVTLTLTGAKGTCTCTQPGYITVYSAPKARFSAVPRSGDAPLTVNFTNESSGIVTSWLWNFGEGTTSTDPNPAHTYESPRTYNAKLTVYGPGGASSKTMSILVKK
ncbi:MAG: PKD domain-containing protein [Syntrophobacteraceae bacterium]